jgi:very-short-patch-repair endonuclease
VAPRARIPAQLKFGPFTLDDAKAAGVTPSSLRGKSWARLGRGLYCGRETSPDPWKHLQALQRLIPRSVFAGRTAAWMHGLHYVDPSDPVEVIVPLRSGMRSSRGLNVRRSDLAAIDVVELRHVRATGIHRTLCDLCPRLTGVEALALLDSSLRLRLTDRSTLARSSSLTVRALAALAEPAESPMETRLRWLLLQAGLPRPQVQAPISEARARADLYYPDFRLIIEFDGGNHRDRLVEDNRRQNLLTSAGYAVLRFTASDIYNRPETIVAQVSAGVAVSARRPGTAPR